MSALPSIKSNSGLIQLGNNATAAQNLSIDSSPLTSSLPAQIYLGKDGVSSVAVASISNVDGSITIAPIAVPAGGSTAAGLKMSTVASLGVFFGSGVPTLSAAQGSLYIRTDGSSTSTRMYINTNGSTTWTNVTTAA